MLRSPNGWFRDSLARPPTHEFSDAENDGRRPLVFTRLWADRRAGTDRRAEPRRQSVAVVGEEKEAPHVRGPASRRGASQ